jgi:hypothetical protein
VYKLMCIFLCKSNGRSRIHNFKSKACLEILFIKFSSSLYQITENYDIPNDFHVLCGCEMGSLILQEEHHLKVSKT